MTPIIPDAVANTVRRNSPSDFFSERALRHAITRLYMMSGPDDLITAVYLQDILIQEGMTEFVKDAGFGPDDLPSLIDIVVRG